MLITKAHRDAIQAWHDERRYECCAYSEGQMCCIDALLEDASTEPKSYFMIKNEPGMRFHRKFDSREEAQAVADLLGKEVIEYNASHKVVDATEAVKHVESAARQHAARIKRPGNNLRET